MNARYRLVTEQDGHPHISSIVLSREEARDSLIFEMLLHAVSDWEVEIHFPDGDDVTKTVVICRRSNTVRTLSILATSPMEDILV